VEGARGAVARGYPLSTPSSMPVLNKDLPQQWQEFFFGLSLFTDSPFLHFFV